MQSNAKFVFGFHLREIRPQGGFQFRNPNPDFLLTVRLGNPKKDLQNCSRQERSFFANYACVCKTAVLKDSISNPFSDFQSNGKNENLKTDISALTNPGVFRVRLQIRNLNPHFPIECTLRFASKFVSFILPAECFSCFSLYLSVLLSISARFSSFAGLLGFVSVVSVFWDTALP